jgi:hypothetical protein
MLAEAAGNDEDAYGSHSLKARPLFLRGLPRLDATRFHLEIFSHPQPSLPNPWTAGAFGIVAIPSGEFA